MQLLLERNVINMNELDAELDNFVHHATGPNGKKWVKKTLRKWIINKYPGARRATVDDDSPEWAKAAAARGDELWVVHLTDQFRQDVRHIIDYLNDNPQVDRLGGMDQAHRAAQNWIKQMIAKGKSITDEGGTTELLSFSNGYRWVDLHGSAALKREGALMGHCVGGGSYYEKVKRGKGRILSLRSPNNEPHITVEIDLPGNKLVQAKGHSNKPPKAKYIPNLMALFTKEKIFVGDSGRYDIERMSPNVHVLQSGRIIDTAFLHGTFDDDLVLNDIQPKRDYGQDGDLVVPKLGNGRDLHIHGDLEINTTGAESQKYVCTINSSNLIVDGHALLSNRHAYVASGGQAFQLPKKMEVKGDVDVTNATILKWPEHLVVHGNFEVGKRVKDMGFPRHLEVGGHILIPRRLKRKIQLPETIDREQIEWY